MKVVIPAVRNQGNAEQTQMRQGNLEIATQTEDETEKKAKVNATFTRHARRQNHIMRGHEIAMLLKH